MNKLYSQKIDCLFNNANAYYIIKLNIGSIKI